MLNSCLPRWLRPYWNWWSLDEGQNYSNTIDTFLWLSVIFPTVVPNSLIGDDDISVFSKQFFNLKFCWTYKPFTLVPRYNNIRSSSDHNRHWRSQTKVKGHKMNKRSFLVKYYTFRNHTWYQNTMQYATSNDIGFLDLGMKSRSQMWR